MLTADQEERLRELSRRVAHASAMSYQAARAAIESCLERFNIVLKANDNIKSQLDEIHKHISKRHKKGQFWRYHDWHGRTELVTTPASRVLVVTGKPHSRRYRTIRRREQKRRKSRRRA